MEKVNQDCISEIYHQRLFFLVFMFMISISSVAGAQLGFNCEKMKSVFEMLPQEYKNEINVKGSSNPGTYFLDIKMQGIQRKLIYRFNKQHELDHLGIYLIDKAHDMNSIREVLDYLERKFLISALLNDTYPLEQEVYENKIMVLYNGLFLKEQNGLIMIPSISINHDTPLKINYDRNVFLIEWTLDSTNSLKIKIPNNYSLITEKTKDELEKCLSQKLKSSIEGSFVFKIPSKNELTPYEDDIYLYQNECYSNNMELSSSKFFVVNDSIYPVFNSTDYKESVQNLFLNALPSQLNLNLTQKFYGGIDERIIININSFFSNFSSDFKIYFGWQNEDILNSKLSVIISSNVFNYTHLLEVATNSTAIFNKNEQIDGRFFTYIPKENLNEPNH